jgi:hypothetical protein
MLFSADKISSKKALRCFHTGIAEKKTAQCFYSAVAD